MKRLPVGTVYTDLVLDSCGLPYCNALADRCGNKYSWDLFGRRYITCVSSGPNGEQQQRRYEPMFTNHGQLLEVDNCGNKRIAGELSQRFVRIYMQKQIIHTFLLQLLLFSIPQLWNKLPLNLCCVKSPNSFKKQLKTHFFKFHFT